VKTFGASVGHRCQMSCVVHSNPAPEAFYWLDRFGTSISLSSSYGVLSSGNSSVLTLASVSQADYGKFICMASNDVGNRTFQLSLLPPGKHLRYLCCQSNYSCALQKLLLIPLNECPEFLHMHTTYEQFLQLTVCWFRFRFSFLYVFCLKFKF